MRFLQFLSVGILAPIAGLAAPASDPSLVIHDDALNKRENLCSLKTPPVLCQANSSVTVEETALRAYKFYRYKDGPNTIWSLFCNGNKIGTEANTAWCFDASTNMSYAQYSTTDRWKWVDGCVHEHWDQGESIPKSKCYKLTNGTKS
ncbi:hypothetical protein B0J14DRAFT_674211 [Halenospora varia]|nr:hypothetical protein B0J14DRAFT_674211 [Halenospora varia]